MSPLQARAVLAKCGLTHAKVSALTAPMRPASTVTSEPYREFALQSWMRDFIRTMGEAPMSAEEISKATGRDLNNVRVGCQRAKRDGLMENVTLCGGAGRKRYVRTSMRLPERETLPGLDILAAMPKGTECSAGTLRDAGVSNTSSSRAMRRAAEIGLVVEDGRIAPPTTTYRRAR